MRTSKTVSLTAAHIAIKFYGLMQETKYRRLFNDEVIAFYQNQVALMPSPLNKYKRILRIPIVRNILTRLEEWLLPGDLMHILQRKWMIQKLVDSKLNDGFKQVLVAGGGFDHTAYFAATQGIRALEIDLLPTVLLKKRMVEKLGNIPPCLSIKPFEINAETTAQFLTNIKNLSATCDTLIITEGFWDYRQASENAAIAELFSTYFQSRLSIISTMFDINQLAPWHRFVFRNSIRLCGEKIEDITGEKNLQKILAPNGLRLTHLFDTEDMRVQMGLTRDNLKSLAGFYLAEFNRKN